MTDRAWETILRVLFGVLVTAIPLVALPVAAWAIAWLMGVGR